MANVHPESGLATDFLNPFNEYIMLAEMAAEGAMPTEILLEWQPVDYESHFAGAGFAGAGVVLAAFRALPAPKREEFEAEVNFLIEAILAHQTARTRTEAELDHIRCLRSRVAAVISGADAASGCQKDQAQRDIDRLFA